MPGEQAPPKNTPVDTGRTVNHMATQSTRWLKAFRGLRSGKDVFTITGGATLGQLATIVATPLLTRLYDPGQMGVYAVFGALIGIFAVTSSLHYELAIPLPKSDRAALSVLKLALACLAVVVGLVTLLLSASGEWLFWALGTPELTPYTSLIGIGLLLFGLSNVLSSWATRTRNFTPVGAAKGSQGVVQSVGQVLFGMAQTGVIGLVMGQLIGAITSLAILLRTLSFGKLASTGRYQYRRLLSTAKRYRRFPLYTSWSSLINALSAYLPPLLLALWFGPTIAGFFALAFRIVQLPFRLIGQATLQVFFSAAAKASREGGLGVLVERTLQRLLSFGLPTFTALALVTPELFSVVFGHEWHAAGEYAQLLIVWTFLSFVTTTLSALVSVLQYQRQELFFQIIYLASLVGALTLGYVIERPTTAIALLGGVSSILLAAKLIWLLWIADTDLKHCGRVIFSEVAYTAAMAAMIVLAKYILIEGWPLLLATAAILFFLHSCNVWVRNSYDLTFR